jgi:GrpB-like predicted nucleotidyltransferase (UPF0157 family)
MTKEELGQLYPIKIEPYNPEWKVYFEQERVLLHRLFSPELTIEHIGSTALTGISAKPTIDILIEQPVSFPESYLIETFTSNGYIHMREQQNHPMFVKGYTPSGLEDISFHIHMGPPDQKWLWDRIYFRDYLNQHDNLKKEYEKLKHALADKFKHDREAYTNAKSDFIKKITLEAMNAHQ